jgi:hypothetical protein
VLKWARNNPSPMFSGALNMINQNDKSQIRAWDHYYHDATIRRFCQEEGVIIGGNRAIQSYRDLGNGWVCNPTYEYGKLVYLILYMRFDEDPPYFIDAGKKFMKENLWLLRNPKQAHGAHNVNPKYIEANQKDCITLVIARFKVEIVKQVLSKINDMYGLTVSKVCMNGIFPSSEKGTRAEKQSFHTCMDRYKYGKHTGTTVHVEVLEAAAKREEIELNDGNLVVPVTRNVARLAATIFINPPLPKEGTPFMIPFPTIPLCLL